MQSIQTVFLMMSIASPLLHAQDSDDWRAEADRRIEQHRKGDLTLTLTRGGEPVPGARIDVEQTRHAFHFGTCVSHYWLAREGELADKYRAFIAEHFNTVVAESAMKWPYTEPERGRHDFALADQFAAFAEEHGLAMRGHTLFWSKIKFKADWMRELSGEPLREAVLGHIRAIVPRYKGRLIGWDVNNEMLNAAFFEERIGEGIRPEMFRLAAELDPDTPLFTNEYSIFCEPDRVEAYLELIRGLQAAGAPVGGIGIQEHAAERILPGKSETDTPERQSTTTLSPRCMWETLDKLGETGLPIHVTEVSFRMEDDEKKAEALDMFFRTLFAHPDVEVIMLWGFWGRAHWLGGQAALVDNNLNPLPAGERLLRLLEEEWHTAAAGETDAAGRFGFRGFYGTYEAVITLPDGTAHTLVFELERGGDAVALEVPEE